MLAVLLTLAIISCLQLCSAQGSIKIEGAGERWMMLNESLTLTCVYTETNVNNNTALEIMRNDLPILAESGIVFSRQTLTNEQRVTIRKDKLETSDAGNYKCSRADMFYTVVVNILTVTVPMEVYNKTKNTLECQPRFYPMVPDKVYDYEVKWTRNDQAPDSTRTNASGTSLSIMNPVWADIGVYKCIFKIPSGDELEFNATLYGPPRVNSKEFGTSRNLVQGDKMELNCPASGFPAPEIMWYKDDVLIEKGQDRVSFGDYKELKDGKLMIYDLQFEDEGMYKCVANSTLFNSTEAEIQIRVKDRLAALWPFLGIVAEVIVLCIIIFIYEKKRSKEMEDEADGPAESVGNAQDHKGKDEVRQRNVRT